eukprot:5049622-Alexandrium_andersonii.AAC.1
MPWPRTDGLGGLAGSSAPHSTEPGSLAAGCRRSATVCLGCPGCSLLYGRRCPPWCRCPASVPLPRR